jgi:aspartate racemase
MSWESSSEYYRIINETVKERLGGLHSARCVMYSVDFAEVETLQHAGRWNEAADLLGAAAQCVQAGGADFLVICTNTMHKLADQIQQHLAIPIVHIADATARQVQAQGLSKVALLGTRFTMEEDFYSGRLTAGYGLEVLLPTAEEREVIHRVIYDELCLGDIRASSKAQYVAIMERLAEQGAEGIILGCTEIGLLVQARDSRLPLFDTTRIHAVAAVDYAIADSHAIL